MGATRKIEPQGLMLGALSGAIFGGLAGHLGAQWTNSKKPSKWVGTGATTGGLLNAHAGAFCEGLGCIAAIIPGLAGVFVLLPLAGVTAAVKGASDGKEGFTTGQKVMMGLGGAAVLTAVRRISTVKAEQERLQKRNAEHKQPPKHDPGKDVEPIPEGLW